MAQRGGKRPGAGRKPGKVGKAKRALAEMAKDHAEAALSTLAEVHADQAAPAAARVSAATAILDRAYGKPTQAMEHTGKDGGPIQTQSRTDLTKLNDAQLEHLADILAVAGGSPERA